MKNFLVANDDGIDSEGLLALVESLSKFGKVYVFAPKEQQSAMSNALTWRKKFKIKKSKLNRAEEAWEVSGTPVDCVKAGICYLRKKGIKIDYVFSGINKGVNLGYDVYYSGTVGAAREGALSGYKSVALSVLGHAATNFEYVCTMLPDLMEMADNVGSDALISVNAPDKPAWKIKGTKLTKLALNCSFVANVEPVSDEQGKYIYSNDLYDGYVEPETDLACMNDGYATISIIRLDPTDYMMLNKIRNVRAQNTLCVFIDVQEKIVPAMKGSGKLVDNTVNFAKCAKELGLPMLVTQQYTKGLGPTVEVLREELADYEVFEKKAFNCFKEPGFEDLLEEANAKNVVIAGIESHICVQQTALGFLDRGYDVTVLADCTSSRKRTDYDAAMRLLADAGCKVTTYEAFVFDLLGSASDVHFKAISDIVK